MSQRLVFLGCSLSNEALTSWTRVLAERLDLPYVNLSQPAGNNLLQLHRLSDYLLSNDYGLDDIFVWQFTAFSRTNFVCPRNLVLDPKNDDRTIVEVLDSNRVNGNYDYIDLPNYFGADVISLLSNPHLEGIRSRLDPYGLRNLEPLLLQHVLSTVKLLTAAGHKVVTVFGWDNILAPEHKKQFLRKLKQLSTHHVHNNILDWCVEKNLEFMDDLHPQDESSIRWATTNVLPILQKILADK